MGILYPDLIQVINVYKFINRSDTLWLGLKVSQKCGTSVHFI